MTDQPRPVQGPVRFALIHLWDLAPSGVESIEARAPRIIEVIALYLPHGHQPKRDAVQRIGRSRKAGTIDEVLTEGVAYSYDAGVFTVRRVREYERAAEVPGA